MLTYSKLDTVTAIYKRRAVRSYTPEKLERATIKHTCWMQRCRHRRHSMPSHGRLW